MRSNDDRRLIEQFSASAVRSPRSTHFGLRRCTAAGWIRGRGKRRRTHGQRPREGGIERNNVRVRRVIWACVGRVCCECQGRIRKAEDDGAREKSLRRLLICACVSMPTTTCQPGQRLSSLYSRVSWKVRHWKRRATTGEPRERTTRRRCMHHQLARFLDNRHQR